MQNNETPVAPGTLASAYDLRRLVEHGEAVQAEETLERVYKIFRENAVEFMAVLRGQQFAGCVSRGDVGFLLGGRFGFALYAKHPVSQHLRTPSMKFCEEGDVMALLDQANTTTFGHPEPTQVNIGVKPGPAILISGHDLRDLDELLKRSGDALGRFEREMKRFKK